MRTMGFTTANNEQLVGSERIDDTGLYIIPYHSEKNGHGIHKMPGKITQTYETLSALL